jgi:hypothetical protein
MRKRSERTEKKGKAKKTSAGSVPEVFSPSVSFKSQLLTTSADSAGANTLQILFG